MYGQLQAHDRDLIAVWKGAGLSNKEVARRLHRSPSTIGREVTRNRRPDGHYVAIRAQELRDHRQATAKRRHPLKNPDIYAYTLVHLRDRWSPEQIAGRLKNEHRHAIICPETIYQFVYDQDNREKHLWEYLPRGQKHRRKKYGRSSQKARIPQRVSIHRRSEAVDQRAVFGHWEGDTIEGKKSDGDGIHTEVERQTRFLLARKVDRIASPETIRVQLGMFRGLPDTARQSTTLDNGREHHHHVALRFLGMRTYFADPYASWQRGTNENTNGLVRQYLPKGSSFRDLSRDDLDDIVAELNDRPRKCLGYNTPREEFDRLTGVAVSS